ncbi:MAG: hypothetical protein PHT94_01010 [Candidatus Nanoarchaeia archaeon]|nr:hypothetical protein [Candidatus Nanoarchaeia archaeon]
MSFTTFRLIFAIISIIIISIKLHHLAIKRNENVNIIYSFFGGLSIGFLFGMLTIG